MKNTSGSTINSIHVHPEAKLLRVKDGDQPDMHVSLGPECKMPVWGPSGEYESQKAMPLQPPT